MVSKGPRFRRLLDDFTSSRCVHERATSSSRMPHSPVMGQAPRDWRLLLIVRGRLVAASSWRAAQKRRELRNENPLVHEERVVLGGCNAVGAAVVDLDRPQLPVRAQAVG